VCCAGKCARAGAGSIRGPLIYPADAPLAKRYSREEVFELAERAGFRIERWASETRPHLLWPFSGRAKVEWLLSFEASAVP
jgi:hypothetical protein